MRFGSAVSAPVSPPPRVRPLEGHERLDPVAETILLNGQWYLERFAELLPRPARDPAQRDFEVVLSLLSAVPRDDEAMRARLISGAFALAEAQEDRRVSAQSRDFRLRFRMAATMVEQLRDPAARPRQFSQIHAFIDDRDHPALATEVARVHVLRATNLLAGPGRSATDDPALKPIAQRALESRTWPTRTAAAHLVGALVSLDDQIRKREAVIDPALNRKLTEAMRFLGPWMTGKDDIMDRYRVHVLRQKAPPGRVVTGLPIARRESRAAVLAR